MRSQRWTGLILVAPLGLLIWGLLFMYHRNSAYGSVADQLPEERAKARQAHVTLTWDEFAHTPALPADRNAAQRYQQIFDSIQGMNMVPWDGVRPMLLGQATASDRQQVRELLM